jgi:hypothetical protein
MRTTARRTRIATVTLLSGIAVPGLLLAADLGSRPWWPGQPWSQASDPSDLVVCNLVV